MIRIIGYITLSLMCAAIMFRGFVDDDCPEDIGSFFLAGLFSVMIGVIPLLNIGIIIGLISEEGCKSFRRGDIFNRPLKEKDEIVYMMRLEIYSRSGLHDFLTDTGYKYKSGRRTKKLCYTDFADKLDECYVAIGGLIINKTKKTYKITKSGIPSNDFGIKQDEFMEEETKPLECPVSVEPPKSKHPERVLKLAREEYSIQHGYVGYCPDDDIILESFSWNNSKQGFDVWSKACGRNYDLLAIWQSKQDYEEANKERGIDKYQYGVDYPSNRSDYIQSVSYKDGKIIANPRFGDVIYASDIPTHSNLGGLSGDELIVTTKMLLESINKLTPTHIDYKEPKQLRDIISL